MFLFNFSAVLSARMPCLHKCGTRRKSSQLLRSAASFESYETSCNSVTHCFPEGSLCLFSQSSVCGRSIVEVQPKMITTLLAGASPRTPNQHASLCVSMSSCNLTLSSG